MLRRMGIYSHYAVEQLQTMRDQLMQSLHDRLIKPTSVMSGERRAQYDQQTAEIRKELAAVCAEIDARSGVVAHRPIYIV